MCVSAIAAQKSSLLMLSIPLPYRLQIPHISVMQRGHHFHFLTYWGRVHICVGNLTIIDSNNGLSPGRHQAIILTNAGISLFGPLETISVKC